MHLCTWTPNVSSVATHQHSQISENNNDLQLLITNSFLRHIQTYSRAGPTSQCHPTSLNTTLYQSYARIQTDMCMLPSRPKRMSRLLQRRLTISSYLCVATITDLYAFLVWLLLFSRRRSFFWTTAFKCNGMPLINIRPDSAWKYNRIIVHRANYTEC